MTKTTTTPAVTATPPAEPERTPEEINRRLWDTLGKTDPLGNAFKFVGVAADIHMGQFDDSKYVQDRLREELKNEDVLGRSADALLDQLKAAPDLDTLTALRLSVEDLIAKFKEVSRA